MLLDPVILAECIPGCQELVQIDDGVYRMKMKIALAAVSGDFVGTVKITEAVRPLSFRMAIEGAGRIGHVRGSGQVSLADSADETKVGYDGDVQVGGTIAAIGQRLIDTTSRMMFRNFFGNLVRKTQAD